MFTNHVVILEIEELGEFLQKSGDLFLAITSLILLTFLMVLLHCYSIISYFIKDKTLKPLPFLLPTLKKSYPSLQLVLKQGMSNFLIKKFNQNNEFQNTKFLHQSIIANK